MAKPSFRMFDYRVRPAKSAERRMLSEAFRRLSFFEPVENYRYVGFGSTTFTDFILFHKTLNIKQMISIEKRDAHESRFEFNKPFHCIDIEYGGSNEILPKLRWDSRTITWLDYDGRLTESVLQDVAYVSANSVSGNILAVTVNSNSYSPPNSSAPDKEIMEYRLQQFRNDVGDDKVPGDIKGKDLEGETMAVTCHRLVENEIKQALRDRNGLRLPEQKISYQPLFNFIYQDGVKMLTVGGIFCEVGDAEILERCQFEKLDYCNLQNQPYKINVPIMTPRERHYLDQRLPEGTTSEGKSIGLTENEISNYVRLYRYCPSFAEVEMS